MTPVGYDACLLLLCQFFFSSSLVLTLWKIYRKFHFLTESTFLTLFFSVFTLYSDIGAGMFENCLPIVLLTLRGGARSCLHDARERYLHIWLAGVYEFPCDYTLTVWIHGRDESEPTLIKCLSNTVLNMNSSFNPDCVVRCSLTLSPIEVEQLSWRSGSISCQVVFHWMLLCVAYTQHIQPPTDNKWCWIFIRKVLPLLSPSSEFVCSPWFNTIYLFHT